MNIKYIIAPIILVTLAFSYHHFKTPKYVGSWENEELKLTILENKIVMVNYNALPKLISYGDWSEIKKDEILIRYKLLNADQVATFNSKSGKIGYFDNDFRTTVLTRIED